MMLSICMMSLVFVQVRAHTARIEPPLHNESGCSGGACPVQGTQTNILLQKTPALKSMMTKDSLDNELDDEANLKVDAAKVQPEQASDGYSDGLPETIDLKAAENYAFSAVEMEAGSKLLLGRFGHLATEFVLTVNTLMKYWARTIKGSDGGSESQATDENTSSQETSSPHYYLKPSMEFIENTIRNFRNELLRVYNDCASNDSCNTNIINPNHHTEITGEDAHREVVESMGEASCCPEDAMEFEVCMACMKCLIEDHVGNCGPDHIEAPMFAAMCEMEDEILEHWKDFEQAFQKFRRTDLPTCKGENNVVNLMETFTSSSPRHAAAVAVVAQIKRATNRMVESLSTPNRSLLLLDTQELYRIWDEPCQALGCNPKSWLDINTFMHDHAATLVGLDAPAFAIREHVSSVRTGQRAIHKAFDTSDALTEFVDTDASHQHGTVRYAQHIKAAGTKFDAAVSQLYGDGKAAMTTYGFCWKPMAGFVSGYVKKIPSPISVWGAVVSLTVSAGITNPSLILDIILGRAPTICAPDTRRRRRWWETELKAGLKFGIVIGFVPGTPHALCARAGVTLAAALTWSSCKNEFSLGLTAGMAGALVVASSACGFGPTLGIFKCIKGVFIGFAFFCCSFNLSTGAGSCFGEAEKRVL